MALKEFYGDTCPHCKTMEPLVKQLEEETKVKVEKIEVWNSEENAAEAEKLDGGKCGGVPFFINTDTGATICGEASYEELKTWAGV